MIAPKSTSTALTRILLLPMAVGLLAGCDYASKLPDAPTTLGYELQTQKPPSVTGIEPEQYGPPPAPVGVAAAPQPAPLPSAPLTKQARIQVPDLPSDLNTQALQVPQYQPKAEAPRAALAVPETTALPAPQLEAPQFDTAQFEPPQFEAPQFGAPTLTVETQPILPQTGTARVGTLGTPPDTQFSDSDFSGQYIPNGSVGPDFGSLAPTPEQPTFGATEFQAPEFQAVEIPAFEPVPFDAAPQPIQTQPIQTFDVAALATDPIPQSSQVLYSPQPAPVALPQVSPLTVIHSRLPNGAIVNVHPVVGAPIATSTSLSQTIAIELGSTVGPEALTNAAAVFDLRASASRNTSNANAEWKLFSAAGELVGAFPESNSGTWTTMGDEALQSMGRRVADRLRRNANLRRATLTSLASVPSITSPAFSARLASGAPSLAPTPRRRPVQGAATPVPAPSYIVDTSAPATAPRFATPRPRPQGIRTAALQPVTPQPIAVQPQPIQPVVRQPIAIAPLQAPSFAPAPAPSTQVAALAPPAPAPLQTAPILQAPSAVVAPPPSFDTLRPALAAAPEGPKSLVFRGVRGAPGDGDQALTREVSRLLNQSGATLSPQGTPNALYLTADVTRTRGQSGDLIKITWHVEDAAGERIGQVVQENEVPAGMLDAQWGEDAFYAAQGARDGIMKLLRTSGALDA